jgi:hypothetical protein
MSDVSIDPNTPNTMYAASGNVQYGVKGSGIYKSTDAGLTWSTLSATLPSPTNTNFDIVARVVVSKNNSQRLYAATNAGILRSTNGGTSWSAVFTGHFCHDLDIRTDVATDYLVAGCGAGSDSQIVVNTDAAGTGAWNVRYSDPVDAGANTSMNIQIAIAPSQQSTMYASLVNSSTEGTLSFRRSLDGGSTWTVMSTTNTLGYCGSNNMFGTGGFGFIFNAIAVDPTDPLRVWIGGTLLFRSDDGGATWGKVAHTNQFTHPSTYTHVDYSSIVFHPQYNGTTNKIAFVTNDGGIFKTSDARAATDTKGLCRDDDNYVGQVPWATLNNTYASNQFVFGAVYSDGTGYFGGTWDNGTLWGNNSVGVNGWFSRWMNGDGGFVAVDPKDSQIQFTFGPIVGHGKIVKTTNEGLNWNDVTQGNTSGLGFAGERDADNDTPFVVDPTSCSGSSCGRWWTAGLAPWRSADGVAFTQAGAQLTAGSRIGAVGACPTNPNRVLAGTDVGDIMLTNIATNSTSSTVWTQPTRPRNGYVSSIVFDPAKQNVVYAAYSSYNGGSDIGHFFKSTDGGAHWSLSDGSGSTGLPDAPIHQIVVNPFNTSRIYVGTEIGIFISDDGGATWAAETGIGHVIVTRLVYIKATSELFAFTWGRGLRKVPDPNPNATSYVEATPAAAAVTASSNDGNVPGNTVDNNLTTRWAASGDGQWLKFDLGTNRTVGHVSIGIYSGNGRHNVFDLQVSTDNTNWTTVWSGASSGTTTAQEVYDFPDVTARYVRYFGHGNVSNAGVTSPWNSVTEVDIFAAPQGTMAPPPPTGLVATAGDGQVMLSWNASSGATSYNVKRGTTSGGPYNTVVGSPTTTRFVDTTATNGTTFFYVVTATNGTEGGPSAQASAQPSASTCKTATGGATGAGAWINTSFPSQTGTFTAEYDGTPSTVFDSSITMSKGAQTTFTGFATLTRFNTSGNIDARNGGAYAANVTLPYSGGSKYHFRLVVNVSAHTYSIFVTPPGGSEQTIGTGFAFRTEQNTVTSLDNWGVEVNKVGTTLTDKVCNFWVHP